MKIVFVDADLEVLKKSQLEKKNESERLYVLNRFLFSHGVRELCVPRRYLPEFRPDTIRFRTNPAYLPILKLHRQLVEKISYTANEADIAVDVSGLKT